MSIFEDKLSHYSKKFLTEQPEAAPVEAPAPDPAAGAEPAAAEAPAEPEMSMEDAVNKIYEESKKPWIELSNILARAMFHDFDQDQIDNINQRLSEGDVSITVEDFRDYIDNQAKGIVDELDPHNSAVKTASLRVFEIVKDVMNEENVGGTVTRAEDR